MSSLANALYVLYLLVPLAALGLALRAARRAGRTRPIRAFMLTCTSGTILGCGLVFAYAFVTHAYPGLFQIALTCYVAIAVLCILKGVNWLLREGLERGCRVRVPADRRGGLWLLRACAAMTLRTLVLFAIGLPYIMAVAMVYRPKVSGGPDPMMQFNFAYEPVEFRATDGVNLSGWWIPAAPPKPGQTPPAEWGRRTVVLCHGLGADKSNQLAIARDLPTSGYNVLAFDFRAHGESGGQVCTFGDRERRDVLGAVRWLRAAHPEQCERIFGLGVSMGGAALVAAAADDSPEGRAIDAVAVCNTYDSLDHLMQTLGERYLRSPGLRWMAHELAVPIASAHAGTSLPEFRPASVVDRVAPRPLLVVHSRGDELIPFQHGKALFDQASQPKLRFWVGRPVPDAENYIQYLDAAGLPADHNNIIINDEASRAIRLFFEWDQKLL